MIDRHVAKMPPKRKPDHTDDDDKKDEMPLQQKEEPQELSVMADYTRRMMNEKRDERKRQQFVQQYVAPLHESEKYNGAKNARTFVAKWDAKMTGATIPLKHRSEILMMLLREYEATKMREDIADAVIDLSDWLTVKHHFETIFAPTTNDIVRDAATVLNLQQQPVEDTSKFAVRWRDSLKLFPMAENIEISHLVEQNKWLFVAGLKPALREPLMQ